MSQIKLLLDVVNDIESLAESLKELANAMTKVDPAAGTGKTADQKESVSIEDIRAVLVPISQSGRSAAVKALLQKHGAERLSEIEPERYQALFTSAKELANE